jgi:predicted metal-dependent enzyme (double-stranded beta helix superfamily)
MQKLKHLLSRCMSQSVVICTFLLLQNTSFAQIDIGEFQYEPGYLITAKGDTMRGLIKYTRQYELSHRVQFRNEKTREPETFRPFAVKAFFCERRILRSQDIRLRALRSARLRCFYASREFGGRTNTYI